jgi:hypothetical protein
VCILELDEDDRATIFEVAGADAGGLRSGRATVTIRLRADARLTRVEIAADIGIAAGDRGRLCSDAAEVASSVLKEFAIRIAAAVEEPGPAAALLTTGSDRQQTGDLPIQAAGSRALGSGSSSSRSQLERPAAALGVLGVLGVLLLLRRPRRKAGPRSTA